MKLLKFLLLLLPFITPIVSYGMKVDTSDTAVFKYLKLDNRSVYFERIYIKDSLNSQELGEKLKGWVPTITGVAGFNSSDNVITASLNSEAIPYKQYGRKYGKMLIVALHPFTANVQIVWKDKRYKVVVSNIVFIAGGSYRERLVDWVTKKEGQVFDKNWRSVDGGKLIEEYLSDLFELSSAVTSNW